ncbi:MAG: hypothetical protein Q8909_13310 [Bacteroidota bacterium]|nr:hypothetical protein [Bacteroidota bacterium]
MKKSTFFILCISPVIMGSCAHCYYSPSLQLIPLFTEKNDLRLIGGAAFGEGADGYNAGIAYSITDQFALMSDYTFSTSSDATGGKQSRLNGALGYYKAFKNSFVFETYAGLGSISEHHSYTYPQHTSYGSGYSNQNYTSRLSASKLFLQPSFGYTSGSIDLAVGSRFDYLMFNNIETNLNPSLSEYTRLMSLSQHNNILFFEPSFTLRVGWEYVKLQIQYIPLIPVNYEDKFLFGTKQLNIGLYFNFPQKKNKVSSLK